MTRQRAFTLVELLVVVSIIALLMAILSPSLRRTIFLTRSTRCGSNQRQIASGMTNYAAHNRAYYPARYSKDVTNKVYNHAYWFGWTNSKLDMHEEFEKYLGPSVNDGPPEVLLCAVEPTGIWGQKVTWPLGTIYRSNVVVYAGYDWSNTTSNSCVPHHPLGQMPQRTDTAPVHRPLSGDLIEYMSGNSSSGFAGWDTPHAIDPAYHNRGPGPEDQPPDPIPFSFPDGSARFVSDLEHCYTDAGWGTNYWPVP